MLWIRAEFSQINTPRISIVLNKLRQKSCRWKVNTGGGNLCAATPAEQPSPATDKNNTAFTHIFQCKVETFITSVVLTAYIFFGMLSKNDALFQIKNGKFLNNASAKQSENIFET